VWIAGRERSSVTIADNVWLMVVYGESRKSDEWTLAGGQLSTAQLVSHQFEVIDAIEYQLWSCDFLLLFFIISYMKHTVNEIILRRKYN